MAFLAATRLTAHAGSEAIPITSCTVQGDERSVTFRLKPNRDDLTLDGGGPAAEYAATLVLVGPGEPPTVLVSCYGSGGFIGGYQKGATWVSPRFTVQNARYIGDPSKDKWRSNSWVLPVKPEWNEFTVKTDLITDAPDSKGKILASSSRTFRFFAFVLEMSPAGRLTSPIPGFPEVRTSVATTDADGNVYAALDCYTGNDQGRSSRRALVRFAANGSNVRVYPVKDDSAVPMAADNSGRLYAYCIHHIVEFNADLEFVRPIAAFTVEWDEELTREVLRSGNWNSSRKRRTVPLYRDLYPDRFSSGCVLYGNDLFYRACAYPVKGGGNKDVYLATTSLIDGQTRKLASINFDEGPVPGPGNGLYVILDLKDSERPVNSRGYRTDVMKVFSPNGGLQQTIHFSETWTTPAMKGFDGNGYLLGRHWIGSPDFKRFGHLTYGRIRTRYFPPANSRKERIDVPFQRAVEKHEALFAGHWYHGGALYVLYADGAIVKCVSQVPGAERDPFRNTTAKASKPLPVPGPSGTTGPASQPTIDPQTPSLPVGDPTQDPLPTPDGEFNPSDADPSAPESGTHWPAAAGAGAAAGLLAALGSFLFTRALGVSFDDYRSAWDSLFHSSAEAPPPPIEEHLDGEVNANGEVWSENSGWSSRENYERDLAARRLIANANRTRYNDNPYVREARADWLNARKAHFDSQVKRVEKTAELLAFNLGSQQEKEAGSRFYTRSRDEFFRTILDSAIRATTVNKGAKPDLDAMAETLDSLNDIVERQGRAAFEPSKTLRDTIEDGAMRTVAVTADVLLTKGAMNAAVSGFQTARDGVLSGMSEGEALTRGTIQGVVEGATAGIGHLAGKLGMNQALVMAGTNAAIGAATSIRDRVAAGKDLVSAITRGLGDGAFAGATSYVTDTVTDIAAVKVKPYIEKAKSWVRLPTFGKAGGTAAEIAGDVAGKLNRTRAGMTTGANGDPALSIEDAKTLMRDTRTGRVLKSNHPDFGDVGAAHANTVNQIKKAHDAATCADFQKENPLTTAQQARGAVRKEVTIEDFNTPGRKSGASVDRDQRMMETLYDKDGNILSRREVPRHKWEQHSQKNFAEATNYSEGDFRKTLASGDQAAFDKMSPAEKLKFYQEKHGWKCTDKFHTEASIDNSDQIIDPKTGKVTTASEPNILKVKRGEGSLKDAQGEALMYVDKVRDAARSENPCEAYAQARKAVDTYGDIRKGCEIRGMDPGKIKPGMEDVMDSIRRNADAAAQGNPQAAGRIQEALQRNGFRDINDFADKIGGHIESTKWAKPKAGTCGGAFYASHENQ